MPDADRDARDRGDAAAGAGARRAPCARHQPDWPIEIVLVGRELAAEPSPRLPRPRAIADVLDIDVESLIARHSRTSWSRF